MFQVTAFSCVALALAGALVHESEQIPAPTFAAPVQLTADGEPIRELSYPSPTLFDIDGDGRRELVLGDIIGHVASANPDGRGADTDWHGLKRERLDGEDLRLNNW